MQGCHDFGSRLIEGFGLAPVRAQAADRAGELCELGAGGGFVDNGCSHDVGFDWLMMLSTGGPA